jgi:hypothetical protein
VPKTFDLPRGPDRVGVVCLAIIVFGNWRARDRSPPVSPAAAGCDVLVDRRRRMDESLPRVSHECGMTLATFEAAGISGPDQGNADAAGRSYSALAALCLSKGN